ncbi:hypothetical protein LCW13_10675 [Cobetia amphilecti]|uniref:hypothetical protein n=1 Tax=Cobetia amphilecti TaxID=1055104 RepID=UPI001CDA5F80|nr:hypothetical protein [Cobetia amphilecti]UBU47528.1 hypothetical protein LCW13_10675 [Cobetia amphilecti]
MISAILIIHNDHSLLEYSLESVKNYVDEIVVVDGAYDWVAPIFEHLGVLPYETEDKKELIDILDRSGISYKYYNGTWLNETEKRKFGITQAKYDNIMNIDSDEFFDIDIDLLDEFYNSPELVIGNCSFPLYFTKDKIGQAKGIKSPPNKAVFVNRNNATVEEIVDSMFLMVPNSERVKKLPNSKVSNARIGVIHHLSNFRSINGGHNRARFYNMLSSRVSGNINLLSNIKINSDHELVEVLKKQDKRTIIALNNSFYFHRLTIGYPVIKDNQEIVDSNESVYSNFIEKIYNEFLADMENNLIKNSRKEWILFSGKKIFLDVTYAITNSKSLRFFANQHDLNQDVLIGLNLFAQDSDVNRKLVSSYEFTQRLVLSADKDYTSNTGEVQIRYIAEISFKTPADIISFNYEIT